jgi:hypothetical protein
VIEMFVVYANPKDYPGKFVVRRGHVGGERILWNVEPTAVTDGLEEARAAVPNREARGRFPRADSDDPVIVETYV